jgi:hypothetical protein
MIGKLEEIRGLVPLGNPNLPSQQVQEATGLA